MPIYEFRCKKCKNEFECLVFGKDSDVCCPTCKGKRVERLMSASKLQEQRQIRLFLLIGLCNLWGWLLQHLPLIKPVLRKTPLLSPQRKS